MTADQAIRQDAHFNLYALHLDTMEDMLLDMGAHQMARVSMDSARLMLDIGENDSATLYINRARWALDMAA